LKKRSFDPWVDALKSDQRDPSDYRVGIIRSILVTDDQGKDWLPVRQSERYRMELYRQFFKESGEGFGEKGEQVPQTWIVGDVDHCVAELKKFITDFGITDIVSMAVPPGMRADDMSASLERLFTQVVPRVKAELGQ
jgi:alkanesulfonate monooxygenase SsuD/methylene tetrahydromethanopterin reductase-like flavin-dependent oxidoreductase (luciferase family)